MSSIGRARAERGRCSMKSVMTGAQQLGRAFMLPIAVLPVAALLLRLGQPDLIGAVPFLAPIGPPIAAAGGAIFSNLGLLFAVGVAVGLARENHGAAGGPAAGFYFLVTPGGEGRIGVGPGHPIRRPGGPPGVLFR